MPDSAGLGPAAGAAAMDRECPLCGYVGPFKAHKRSGRPNASCGRCGSRERHRLVALYLGNLGADAFAGLRVLHFSPEHFLAPYFARAALYVTADLSSPEADFHTDITKMGVADAAFDVVMCNHVLEHIPDDAAAIAEFHRILAPGGTALITVPLDGGLARTYEDPAITAPEDRSRHFGQFDHVRLYGRDIAERLARPGFAVTVFKPNVVQQGRYAIHDATEILVARKPG
ncbi:MAG: methyltransferase domain-containing protein [Alphaproteobacteria bacterium]|nr:methyltransferase domain-containing protein [Alphaproteobacteria bacterium]